MADGTQDMNAKPTEEISVREVFGIDSDMHVKGFADRMDRVPEIDPTYKFDPDTTLAILAGFSHNRRVMIQGYHGTGKSTHIEQVAARLNWPAVRVNLDSHISRIDLIGRSPNFRKASCHGRCATRPRLCSTNTTQAAPTLCSSSSAC